MQHAVILAGGSATRLWPPSRWGPKQPLPLAGGRSLLERAWWRWQAAERFGPEYA